MRFLAQLRLPYIVTNNLTYPHKSYLSYGSMLDLVQSLDSSDIVPIHLNALINRNNTETNPRNQVKKLKVPGFNEYVTDLTANLSSASLQKSSPTHHGCRKYYCTENTSDAVDAVQKQKKSLEKTQENDPKSMSCKKNNNCDSPSDEIVQDLLGRYDKFRNETTAVASAASIMVSKKNKDTKRDPHIVCVREGTKGCMSPGLSDKPPYIPEKTSEADDPQSTNDGLRLLDSNLYQKSLKEAQIKRKLLEKDAEVSKTNNYQKTEIEAKQEVLRACQSKKPKNISPNETEIKGSLAHTESARSKCGHKAVTETKCGNLGRTKCGSKSEHQKETSCGPQRGYENLLPKSPKSKCSSDEPKPTCKSVKIEQINQSKLEGTDSNNSTSKSKTSSNTTCRSEKAESKDPCKMTSSFSKCSPEQKSGPTTLSQEADSNSKCSSKSESNLNDPCKIPPITKMRSSCSSSGTEDPCKVPPITFKKSGTDRSCNDAKSDKSSSASKRSSPKCKTNKEGSKDLCKKISSTSQPSKCSSKCGSSSLCNKSQNEASSPDFQNACKRAAKVKSASSCGAEPRNPCKSSCDSMEKPKAKCGRPPRGDTKPKCKKDSKCGSKNPPSSKSKCASKEKKTSPASKCGSKTCAPSPKSSQDEIKSKSTCSSRKTQPKGHLKREYHTLPMVTMQSLTFNRKFSDDCPQKPKGGYKPESERSDEYRRETCGNFSWKSNKARKPRINKSKNCYPEETQEFCPDTACYKVYAETSGKADRKKGSKNPKANKIKNKKTLCEPRTSATGFQLQNQKFYFSSQVDSNQEAYIERPHKICTRNIMIPKMSNNDVLISIDSVALSDTDIYMFETGAKHTPELTLGNEAAGVVQEVGKNVCDLKVGDHVVLESGIPCAMCSLCKTGRYNLCNNISFKGFLKKCCVHPASFCHKICTETPLEHAALVPQLALGCNACSLAAIKPHSNVAIIGSCAVAVCAAICALSSGAENVCVMCGMPETRILIEQFVTEKVNCFDNTVIEKDIVRMMLASLGTFPDIVINCSGSTKTMNAAIIALKPTGTCVVAGFLSECVCFNIMDVLMKEIRILPSFRSKNMFPAAIHLLESGRVPADCLIANCEPCKWKELECAFKLALSEGNNGPRKSIVKVGS